MRPVADVFSEQEEHSRRTMLTNAIFTEDSTCGLCKTIGYLLPIWGFHQMSRSSVWRLASIRDWSLRSLKRNLNNLELPS
jgi:hypothetical protein